MAIIAELHQEHLNLQNLLNMLEQKVERLKEGDDPNYLLLNDVISYVGGYADAFHHPREDQIYAYLQGRHDELDELMEKCGQEHHRLKQLSTGLSSDIEGVLNDAAVIPVVQLVSELELFLKAQKDHLDFEESAIFPVIMQQVEEHEWDTIAESLPTHEDPAFADKQRDEYRELYRSLMSDLR